MTGPASRQLERRRGASSCSAPWPRIRRWPLPPGSALPATAAQPACRTSGSAHHPPWSPSPVGAGASPGASGRRLRLARSFALTGSVPKGQGPLLDVPALPAVLVADPRLVEVPAAAPALLGLVAAGSSER